MIKIKTILMTATLLSNSVLSGCSAYKAISQPGPADLTGIGVGTPRQEIFARLGAPKMVDTAANGNKQDVFEFQSGLHQASKARAILYVAADVFTLALAEIILWPIELTVLESATCTGVATYDTRQKIESWHVANKDNSGQTC
jgi:hypothetical protein